MSDIYLHPVALAAWVGMLATSLNLLPASQLDGGHILYAVWPRAHRAMTYLLIIVLLPMGLFWWGGWLVWVCLLLLFGANHPPVVEQPGLNAGRKWLAVSALAIFALTFMPAPLPGSIDWHKVSENVHGVVRWLHQLRSQ
jgi:membrane-associated protease RseP (regulator of RpoE activity)